MEGVNLNAATAFGIIFLARIKRVKKKEKKEKETKSRCYTIGQNDVCRLFLWKYNRMKHESFLIDNYLDRLLVMIFLNEPCTVPHWI